MRALLFSGGVESTCLALLEKPDLAITIDYGQVSADGEINAAAYIANAIGFLHRVVRVQLRHLGSGDLVGRPALEGHEAPEHWPYRNQMLITIAAMALADENLESLSIGTVRSDRIHADGTLTFLSAMNALLRAQNPLLSLKAPAADWTTLELVERARVSRDLLGWTFSCHRSSIACGTCRGCNKTLSLFEALDSGSSQSSPLKSDVS
jgi:7-cyano-7-deazaguanine synthase